MVEQFEVKIEIHFNLNEIIAGQLAQITVRRKLWPDKIKTELNRERQRSYCLNRFERFTKSSVI